MLLTGTVTVRLMQAVHGLHPSGALRASNFAPGKVVDPGPGHHFQFGTNRQKIKKLPLAAFLVRIYISVSDSEFTDFGFSNRIGNAASL